MDRIVYIFAITAWLLIASICNVAAGNYYYIIYFFIICNMKANIFYVKIALRIPSRRCAYWIPTFNIYFLKIDQKEI